MDTGKNMFSVGAVHEPPLRWVLFVVVLFGLSACKIDLKIFGTGTVESDSGSMACSNNDPNSANQSGDCTQEYVTVITDCDGYGISGNDTWEELPNCTLVTTEAPITETLLASPSENDSFDGWEDGCLGAGNCEITVDAGDADDQEAVMTVEAHFDEEPAPEDAVYTYNYLGQKASKNVNGIITYFVYDEAGNLLSEIDGNNSTANNIKSRKNYVYLEGEYVAHVEYTGDTSNSESEAQIFYPLNDHLGQPIALLRADANISHEQYTDPFGKMHAQYLNTSIGTGPEPQNRRLPGQYYDAETGYHDNHMRTYFPDASIYSQPDWLDVLGRNNDPALMVASMMGALQLPQGMQQNHLYWYAKQNPINETDPDGLWGVPSFSATGLGGAKGATGGTRYAPTVGVGGQMGTTTVSTNSGWGQSGSVGISGYFEVCSKNDQCPTPPNGPPFFSPPNSYSYDAIVLGVTYNADGSVCVQYGLMLKLRVPPLPNLPITPGWSTP